MSENIDVTRPPREVTQRVISMVRQITLEPDRHTRPVICRTSVPTHIRKWAHETWDSAPSTAVQILYHNAFREALAELDDSGSALWSTDAASSAVVTITRTPR